MTPAGPTWHSVVHADPADPVAALGWPYEGFMADPLAVVQARGDRFVAVVRGRRQVARETLAAAEELAEAVLGWKP